jgi:hypothetical protein
METQWQTELVRVDLALEGSEHRTLLEGSSLAPTTPTHGDFRAEASLFIT